MLENWVTYVIVWSIALTRFVAGEAQSRKYSVNCDVGC